MPDTRDFACREKEEEMMREMTSARTVVMIIPADTTFVIVETNSLFA